VERWSGEITRKLIRHTTLTSVKDLIWAFETHLKEHNRNPRKFVWTKDAQTILARANRREEALGTPH
jgi:hypothetical protein